METPNLKDPTLNVREFIGDSIKRVDDLRAAESHRVDGRFETITDKFKDYDTKYQIQFTAAKEAVGIASTAQEKLVAQALDGAKEAINKADVATDKRFELLSEKITTLSDTLSKNAGAQGIYVTHTDLSVEMEKLRSSFETMLRPVITFMNSAQGTGKGRQDMYGWITSGILFLIVVAGFFIKITP